MTRAPSVAAIAFAMAACAAQPAPSDGPVTATAAGHGLTLSIRAEQSAVRAGDRIEVGATVRHAGVGDLVVSGSGMGVVGFTITRLEDGLTSGGPVMTGDCVPHVIPPGAGLRYPFAKSGASVPGEPNAWFLQDYFAEPRLTLPAGTWRIEARTYGNLGEGCTGELLELSAAVDVVVTD